MLKHFSIFNKKSNVASTIESSKSKSKSKSTSISSGIVQAIVGCFTNQNVENNNEDKNDSLNDTLNDASDTSEQLIFDINESDNELQTTDDAFNKTNKCIQLPCQPNINFPLKKGRKFQFHWFKAYPWLDYQMENDSVFCFCCKNYPSARGNNKDDDSFVINGFDNWRKGLEKFKKHEKSENHFFTFKCWQNEKNKILTIAEKVSSHHKEIVEKNRKCLYQLVQIIYFLAKQGLSLRGHNEKLMNQKFRNDRFY
jgi:hypothetical protein